MHGANTQPAIHRNPQACHMEEGCINRRGEGAFLRAYPEVSIRNSDGEFTKVFAPAEREKFAYSGLW